MNRLGVDVRIEAHWIGRGQVLGSVSFSVAPGERVAILGPSGVGKSTILQMIAGLTRPAAGVVTVGGKPVERPPRRVALMLQRPALLPWASVRDNILLGPRLDGGLRANPKGVEARVTRLLEKIGLADRADALPTELSGGQQQRVALARALAPEPGLLLLDEPFSALDPATRAGLRADVARLANETGTTVLLVSHDMADAEALCTRAICLAGSPGRIARDGPITASAPVAQTAA